MRGARGSRELAEADSHYKDALGQGAVVPALIGLLDTPHKEITLVAAQALASLSSNAGLRAQIRCAPPLPSSGSASSAHAPSVHACFAVGLWGL